MGSAASLSRAFEDEMLLYYKDLYGVQVGNMYHDELLRQQDKRSMFP